MSCSKTILGWLLLRLMVINAQCPSARWVHYVAKNVCILVEAAPKSWQEAQNACHNYSDITPANLVKIENLEKQTFLTSKLSGFKYWIGLSDIQQEGQFNWTDGSPLISYSNWANSNGPKNHGTLTPDNADCVYLHPIETSDDINYVWEDESCEQNNLFYICEILATQNSKSTTIVPEKTADEQLNNLREKMIEKEHLEESDLENFGLELVTLINNNSLVIESFSFEETIDLLQNVTEMISILVDTEYEDFWRKQNRVNQSNEINGEDLLLSMDEFINSVSISLREKGNVSQTLSYTTENVDMNIKICSTADSMSKDSNIESIFVNNNQNTRLLEIPRSLNSFKNSTIGTIIIIGTIYKNAGSFLSGNVVLKDEDKNVSETGYVGSEVVSAVINPAPPSPFGDPVNIKILATEQDNNNINSECGFLDKNTGYWSTQGCNTSVDKDNVFACECNHLTNFAVLMLPSDAKILTKTDEKVLGTMSKIGCSLSVFFLFITFVIYARLFVAKRATHGYRLLLVENLTVSMALTQLLFATGIEAQENKSVCLAVAVLLHYLCLSSFFWMFCNALHIFFKSINFTLPPRTTLYYCLTGWGTPAVIVGVTLASKYQQYLHEDFCWLSTDDGVRFAFIVPVLLLLAVNFGVLILTIKSLVSIKAIADKSEIDKLRTVLRAIFVLLPVLGLTWLFGIMAIGGAAKVFIYLFTIINSFQGVSVFVCFCVVNKEVRESLGTKFDKVKGRITNSYADNTPSSKTAWSAGKSPKKNSKGKFKTEFFTFNSKTENSAID